MPKLAFLFTSGVEQDELLKPLDFFQSLNFDIHLISPQKIVEIYQRDKPTSSQVRTDFKPSEIEIHHYQALILPGGVVNSDNLRQEQDAIDLISQAIQQEIPVAAICHAPWLLIEATDVSALNLTAYPSLKTDIINAGANWYDQEVVCDKNIITSRTPEDIDSFCNTLQRVLEEQHILA